MKIPAFLRPLRQFTTVVSMLFTGAIASAGLSFVAQFLLTRRLPVADFGRLAALLAVINFLTPVGSAGVNYFLLRVFGREGHAASRWIRSCMVLATCGTAAASVILLAYAAHWCAPGTVGRPIMIMACVPILLGQIVVDLGSVRFQLEGRFSGLSLWQCITQVGRFAVAVGAIVGFGSLQMVVFGYAVVGGLSIVISAILLLGLGHGPMMLEGHPQPAGAAVRLPGLAPSWREAAPKVMPFALMTMFYICYFQGPVAVLEWLDGGTAAGVYNSAFLVISAFSLIPTVIYMRFLMPRICRWAEHERSIFTAVFHVGVPAMAFTGLACMAAVLLLAPWLLPLLFGQGYVAGVGPLMILSLSIPIRFVQTVFSSVFVSERDMLRKSGYLAISALIGLIGSLCLVPRAGPVGAAIATVSAETMLLILHMVGASRFIPGIQLAACFRPVTFRAALTHLLRVHSDA